MEMFDTHRRDILNFDNYMDLKKPGFGGPASATALRDGKGKLTNTKPRLAGFQRTVERDPAFSHPVYDPTYKAMTNDLVYKQEGKKAFNYDNTRTGIPVVEIDPLKEGKTYTSFKRFINETLEDMEDPEDDFSNWEREDDEERDEATRSNSSLSQIENRLKGFENDKTFGSNPNMSPEDDYVIDQFGDKPEWIKDLEKEAGSNPDGCDECGDSKWMM